MTRGGTASALARGEAGQEVPRGFIPTPERVSQYLEMNTDEVMALMTTVDGRQRLFDNLLEHEEDLRTLDPTFHPEVLREQIDLAGETLQQKERFLKDVQSPEKKGLFRRAWEGVKGFAKKHPIVTAVLATALAAGGVAAGFYFTGNWELLMTSVGLDKIFGAAETAGELAPVTPVTPPLPGGGVLDIPPPMPSPGGPVFVPH